MVKWFFLRNAIFESWLAKFVVCSFYKINLKSYRRGQGTSGTP
jgi:hypothetical protein